ncbi:MAG TPA: DUF2510 domain-containing protein [Acidimicrobiales bacterium]|nr:DUF2510 domain-containing protein [Acidimicrobiales bacterium]
MTAPQNPGPTPADQAVIEVKTSFFFLAFLLHFCKVYVALNGQAAPQRWGTVAIPVAPGRYTIEAWCNYFIAPEMGRNGVVIDAMPGTVTRVHWKAPWLIFLKGSIQVLDVQPLGPGAAALPAPPSAAAPTPPATAGGWHPDPSGRHEQRYHDGQQWTEHVSTAGVAGTDPIATNP